MVNSSHGKLVTAIFLCDELIDGLPDVCDELTSDVKGIWHLFCNHKWHSGPKYVQLYDATYLEVDSSRGQLIMATCHLINV